MEYKTNIQDSLKYLKNYIDLYGDQACYSDFGVGIWIDDIIYGLGVSIDPEKYEWAAGYEQFKKDLIAHLSKNL